MELIMQATQVRVGGRDFSSLGDVVRQNAADFSEQVAFRDGNGSTDFATFARRVAALQAALSQRGVRKGDTVAFLSKSRTECIEIFGACDGGAIVVPLNWRLASQELEYLLTDSQPSVFVVEEEFLDRVEALIGRLPQQPTLVLLGGGEKAGWVGYEALLREGSAAAAPSLVSLDDPACIIYTSGTTGRPKGAVLSHRGLLHCSACIAGEMLQLRPDDVTLAVMPLFHIGGMWCHLFPSFAAGATTLIHAGYDADAVLDALVEHQVTNLHLVPTMVADIVGRPRASAAAASLKRLFYAASPMPVEVLKKAMTCFAGSSFYQAYGSTETGCITWLSPADHDRAVADPASALLLRSCGRPFEIVELGLQSDRADSVSEGEVGEITVKSPMTLLRYWNNPDASEKAMSSSGFATGDMGRLDAGGYLYILDRKNDMIISGGENVYPFEVEQVIYEMPSVVEAAVVGLPDPRWVERVVACVVLRAGEVVAAQDVIAFVKSRLAGYKCPKEVFFLDSLPKNGTGKILRRTLRDTLGR
jgi:acyl-CoA synthetase (AMP-forming)/AMP-acid ligase II